MESAGEVSELGADLIDSFNGCECSTSPSASSTSTGATVSTTDSFAGGSSSSGSRHSTQKASLMGGRTVPQCGHVFAIVCDTSANGFARPSPLVRLTEGRACDLILSDVKPTVTVQGDPAGMPDTAAARCWVAWWIRRYWDVALCASSHCSALRTVEFGISSLLIVIRPSLSSHIQYATDNSGSLHKGQLPTATTLKSRSISTQSPGCHPEC